MSPASGAERLRRALRLDQMWGSAGPRHPRNVVFCPKSVRGAARPAYLLVLVRKESVGMAVPAGMPGLKLLTANWLAMLVPVDM